MPSEFGMALRPIGHPRRQPELGAFPGHRPFWQHADSRTDLRIRRWGATRTAPRISSSFRMPFLHRPVARCSSRGVLFSRLREPNGAVLGQSPVRVVGDLPRVPVGIRERAGIPAPERLARRPRDGGACMLGLCHHAVDLLRRAHVVRERHSTPTAAIRDATVLGELPAAPEREDHPARLEEDDVLALLPAARPPERLVEAPCPVKVRDSERDETETLIHTDSLPPMSRSWALLGSARRRSPKDHLVRSRHGLREAEAGLRTTTCAGEDLNLHGVLTPQGPQPCASTNSATSARRRIVAGGLAPPTARARSPGRR